METSGFFCSTITQLSPITSAGNHHTLIANGSQEEPSCLNLYLHISCSKPVPSKPLSIRPATPSRRGMQRRRQLNLRRSPSSRQFLRQTRLPRRSRRSSNVHTILPTSTAVTVLRSAISRGDPLSVLLPHAPSIVPEHKLPEACRQEQAIFAAAILSHAARAIHSQNHLQEECAFQKLS